MSLIYHPLDSTGRQIRLLNILPSRDRSAHLNCTLTYTTIGNEPYEALSYNWGYPEPDRPLILDGKEVKIIESLDAALRRLRQLNTVRSFWIDAICINQADNGEKASQIYLMDSIYRNATQVVIWLGEPDEGTRFAMKSFTNKNIRMTNGFQIWWTQCKHGVQRGWRAGRKALVTGETDIGWSASESEIGLVAQLLDRPWWRRVWIVQEVVLAKKTVVMCGQDEVPWEGIKMRLASFKDGLTSIGMNPPLRADNGTVISSRYIWPDAEYVLLSKMQSAWQSGTWNLNFYDLIYQFRHFDCSLPQDRIFAYLGLVNAEQSAEIRVDYNTPLDQFYCSVARSLITAHEHLLILNCKRVSHPDRIQYQQTRLYSILDQGRFIDPEATVTDKSTNKQREGWIRLPDGWERIVDKNGTWFYDHNTDTAQRESPLKGQSFPPQTQEHFQRVPFGWHKQWDSLGKVKFTYSPKKATVNTTIHLPSWVPDWSNYSTRDPEPLPMLSDADSCYWTSGKNQQVLLNSTMMTDSRVLGVRGTFFDTISSIAATWLPEAERLPISRSGVEILKEWEVLALKKVDNCPYKSPEGRADAFWRTHVADFAGEHAIPAQDKLFFDVWCDQTGWTPNTADLEPNRSNSSNVGRMPREEEVLMKMCTYVYEKFFPPDMNLDSTGLLKGFYNVFKDGFKQLDYIKKRYKEIRARIYRASRNRAMFVTSKGYIGLAPWNAREGDSIVVLLGGCTPFILRPHPDGFTLVGEAYVYGIMGGELFGQDVGHVHLRDFKIF